MTTFENLDSGLQRELRAAAANNGIDPNLLKGATVDLYLRGEQLHFRWRDIEVSTPMPSQQALDSWLDKYGGVAIGAVIAIVAAFAIASMIFM